MRQVSEARRTKIIDAIKESRKRRDLGNGSVWDNLKIILGQNEAEVAMVNLMWADRGFMGNNPQA